MADVSPHHDGDVQGLNLAISLCLTYTLCIVLVRLWIRKGAFGSDDFVVLVATIVTIGHTAADYIALTNGLGKPWVAMAGTRAISKIHGATISGVVLFWIALYTSKLAVLAFLARITKHKPQIRAYQACGVITIVFGLISVLVATVGCPSSGGFYWAFYDNQASCPSQTTRWHVLTAFDVATEVGLLMLPIQLVWGLQMPLQKKAVVLAAFCLRLPVIGLSLARNLYTTQLNSRNSDPSYGGSLVVIWLQVELAYALAANTLSALKGFTESFNSGFGQGFTRGRGSQYDMSGLSKGSAQSSGAEKRKSGSALKSMSSEMIASVIGKDLDVTAQDRGQSPNSFVKACLDRSAGDRGQSPNGFMKLRPDRGGENVTRVSAEPGRVWRTENHTSCSDSSADEMVIVRETELSIHHDQAPMLRSER